MLVEIRKAGETIVKKGQEIVTSSLSVQAMLEANLTALKDQVELLLGDSITEKLSL